MTSIPEEQHYVREPSWFSRLEGILPRAIKERRVTIVGCGSVGSFIADELARAGVSRFTLIDPDVVEWPNLTRTVFRHGDVGRKKAEALSQHLRTIFPDMEISVHACELQDLRSQLPDILSATDVAIAAVDDPRASGILDRYCYHLGVPAVFVGIYKGAKGGEVIVVDPGRSPCLACATGGVRDSLADVTEVRSVSRERDYGTNKLVAEVALGCDIHFVCSAAVKLLLSMLVRDAQDLALAGFVQRQIEQGAHYLMLGMAPDYYIFPATHANAVGQYAFQSVWLKTSGRVECPRCGDAAYREPPV